MHDFDDERTLEEEEMLEAADETNANEIEDLARVSLVSRGGSIKYRPVSHIALIFQFPYNCIVTYYNLLLIDMFKDQGPVIVQQNEFCNFSFDRRERCPFKNY